MVQITKHVAFLFLKHGLKLQLYIYTTIIYILLSSTFDIFSFIIGNKHGVLSFLKLININLTLTFI